MSEKQALRDFRYLEKEDYDIERKINGEAVPLYSEDKLHRLYPEKDYTLCGETYESKKRDKDRDIGRIPSPLTEKPLRCLKTSPFHR